jgi:transcriptional regulator with XRE-family HTH domain
MKKFIKTPTKSQQNLTFSQKPQMARLGQYLKKLREDLGFSLRKTASLADISAAHLCKIEQGRAFQSIGIEVLIKLSRVYQIPAASILEETGLAEKIGSHLPPLSQYLRSKYNLSPQAIRDIEIAKEVVDKKYG